MLRAHSPLLILAHICMVPVLACNICYALINFKTSALRTSFTAIAVSSWLVWDVLSAGLLMFLPALEAPRSQFLVYLDILADG